MHVRAVQGMTMFRLSVVTDVFTFSKQRVIQLRFALENLSCFFQQPAKACQRRALNVNRCHISAGAHKFKSAVLVSGVP